MVRQTLDGQGVALAIPLDASGSHQRLVTESDPLPVTDYYLEVKKGNIEGHSIAHKFGHASIDTTLAVVSNSGIWQAPKTAVSLEFVSDSTDDATGGTGATKIVVQGLDANWEEVSQEIVTNGTTAVSIPLGLTRLYRWYVSESGSYADSTGPSHAGELTIQVSGGGDVWSTITDAEPFSGQSEIGMLTIPDGVTGYLLSRHVFIDTNKTAAIYLMQRPHCDDVTTPYSGTKRLLVRDVGVSGGYSVNYTAPKGPFIGPCDIGFMASAASASDVSVEFEMLLIQDGY